MPSATRGGTRRQAHVTAATYNGPINSGVYTDPPVHTSLARVSSLPEQVYLGKDTFRVPPSYHRQRPCVNWMVDGRRR